MRHVRALAAGLVLTASQVRAHDLHIVEPRAFGHWIGDQLIREVSVDVALDEQLPPDGLPKLGRVDPWVDLIQRSARREHRAGGTRVVVVLRYQLVNSPLQPQVTSVPGGELAWSRNGRRDVETLPSWTLFMSPITTTDLREGLEALRPARSHVATPIRQHLWTAVGGLSLALVGALGLGVEQGLFARLRRRPGPFAGVARQLRADARQSPGATATPHALRLLHRAFDMTAQHPVFGEQLERFLSEHAQFAVLRKDIEAFFEASRCEFYGGVPAALSNATLFRLSQRLGALERSRRAHGP